MRQKKSCESDDIKKYISTNFKLIQNRNRKVTMVEKSFLSRVNIESMNSSWILVATKKKTENK